MNSPSIVLSLAGALLALSLATANLHAAGFDQQSFTPSHDTYVQRGAPTATAGTGDEFLVKRDSATVSGGSDRIGYLRFSTAAPYSVVDSASLFITINNYAGDGTTPFTFEVFGLPDGHANESFNETLLTFNTATNATTTMPGSLNPAGLTSLGTFTSPVASGGTRVEFTNTALRDFIAASGNSELTFIIFRQTPNAGLPTYFASSEDASSTNRPTLLIRTASDSLAVANTTASSILTGSAATNATDSNFTSRWIANADTSSTKSWITLDLGASQTVNRLNFIAYQHGRSYKLESSDNNSTWSLITTDFRSGVGTGVNPLLQDTNRYFQPRTARYFRLISLTSTTGNSLSLWEIKLYNDPAAAPVLARHASLTSSVAALPNSSNSEKLKRVILELALERSQACLNIGDFAAANLLLDDAQNNLATPAATMAAVATGVTGVTQVRAIRPLIETTPATNPYLKRINDGAALYLTTTDLPWEKNTPELNVFADFNLARSTAGDMDALLWVFAHPNSGLRHNPEILRRLLRRTYAYLDAINVHGPLLPAGQLASFYDDFASAPASIVFREFQVLYPGLIPANSNNEWNNAMTTAANNLWSAYGNRTASWVNTDVAIAVELHNLGMKTGRQELIDKGRYFIDDVLTSGRMFADGAVGYIGTQNEAGGYQGTVASYVNRYYQITDRPQALEILQKMEWYGPINGRMIDWWTSPSWKHAWNFISGSGQTGESTNGKNPYTRASLDASIAAAATATNWAGSTSEVGWYESGTTALTRPDSYTVFDRNIQGPRSWQGGLWNTTGTLRAINDNESGHHTIMGAQVMDPDPNFRVNASVMGVFPRIRTATGGSRDTDGTFAEARHAWLTSKLAGDSTVTADFSAIGASHKIHVYGSSSKGTEHDWTARQVWLNLPDRMIGLLDLAPNANLTAYEVQGAIRLGYGGTAYSATKTLVSTGTNAWSYGNLRVKLHDHNYAEVVPEQYAFRVANAPITEITLRDQVGGASNNTPISYTAGTRWKYLAEVRPNTTTSEVTVTELNPAGGLTGIEVLHQASGRHYRVVFNPGSAAVDYTPAINWSGVARLHHSGQTKFRPDWVPAPTGPLPGIALTDPATVVSIPAKGHIVIEEAQSIMKANNFDALDLASSWTGGIPNNSLLAVWNSTVSSANTSTIGAGLDLGGISITNPGGNITINPGTSGVLGIGASGINTGTSSATLTLNAPLRLDANQTWTTGSSGAPGSAQILVNGNVTGSGALTIAATAGRKVSFSGNLSGSSGLTISSGAVLENTGSISVSGAITNSGTLVLAGNASLACTGTFTNNGTLDLLNWNGSLPAGFVNNGTVLFTNQPPALATISNTQAYAGSTLAFTAAASDPNGSLQSLTYSLDPGAPAGASIHPTTGAFSWAIPANQTSGVHPITIRVADNGSPALSDTKTFQVTVIGLPQVAITSPSVSPAKLSGSSDLRVTAAVTGTVTSLAWSTASGPGSVTFLNPSAADTRAVFPAAGSYTLQCTATNPAGSTAASVIVSVNAAATLTFRQGVNGYSHAATMIRADNTTWNSGARDQMLVGKTSSAMRSLLSFSLASIPQGSTIQSAALDLTTSTTAGSGSINTLELCKLTATPVEGTGNGTIATDGVGTGATWTLRDGVNLWTTAGGDFDPAVLSSFSGFSGTEVGVAKSFASSAGFVAAAQAALTSGIPLNLLLRSPLTEASGTTNQFIRFASDDDATTARRPLLTLVLDGPGLPLTNTGAAPSATAGIATTLAGSVPNATALWTKESGPGSVTFGDASNPATSALFSLPGTYVLRLTATNAIGETTSTLAVTVNTLPVAQNASASLAQDSSVEIPLTFSDPDSDPLSVISNTQGSDGSVVVTGSTATYTANPGYVGTDSFTYTVSDGRGGSATASVSITVLDTLPPVITVPGNLTTEATGPGGATVNFTTSANDAVSGAVATNNSPASGSLFPLGTTTVTTSAIDAAGNQTSLTFTITVRDTIAPTITVPANITVEATSASGATVNFTTSASDAVSGALTTNNSPASGSTFPVGTTTVTASATDAANNTASRTFTVTVNAWNTAPVLVTIGDKTIGQGQTLSFTASATDPDLPAQSLTYSLDSGPPAGASIAPATGAFTWTVPANQAVGTYAITVRVTDNGSPAKDDFETITVTVTSNLPLPWTNLDLGSVGLTGSATHNAGTFTLTGAGGGITGSSDACHYVYQTASGDCDIRVRVDSLANTGSGAKAGVMIRESLAANAMEAGVWISPSSGILFTRRTSTGGNTASSSSTGKTVPYWVRLNRAGNTFRAYYSTNGSSWTQFGNNRTISMSATTYIGIAVTSGTTAATCTAAITNVAAAP